MAPSSAAVAMLVSPHERTPVVFRGSGLPLGECLDGDAQHPRQFDLDHDRRQAALCRLRVLWHEEQFVDGRKVAVQGYLQVLQACTVRARELAALGGSELPAGFSVVQKRG